MSKDPDEERAARAAAELKQTEQLLAGFDRPARTPRTPAVRRDFVDYHQKRERSGPDESARRATPRDPKRAEPTFVLRRDGRRSRSWALWIALLVGMPVGGMLVAYWALGRPAPAPPATTAARAPSASTTISAASSPVSLGTSTEQNTPPAAPPTASVDVTPPQSSPPRAPTSASRPASRASSSPSGTSNADFIKTL